MQNCKKLSPSWTLMPLVVKNFSTFYETRCFTLAYSRTSHLYLFGARSIKNKEMKVLDRDKWLTLGTKVMNLQVLTEGPQFLGQMKSYWLLEQDHTPCCYWSNEPNLEQLKCFIGSSNRTTLHSVTEVMNLIWNSSNVLFSMHVAVWHTAAFDNFEMCANSLPE